MNLSPPPFESLVAELIQVIGVGEWIDKIWHESFVWSGNLSMNNP